MDKQSNQQLLHDRQREHNGPLRRSIEPTKSKAKLMRQVSALGMEDPVFRTTESGPEHPSNIFDDMGVHDVPSDMMDMVTVASDHTATKEDGIDMVFFQMSLSTAQFSVDSRNSVDRNGRPPLRDTGSLSHSHHSKGTRPRAMLNPVSPNSRTEENSSSSFTPHCSMSSKENGHLMQQQLRRKSGVRATMPPATSKSLHQMPHTTYSRSKTSLNNNVSPGKLALRPQLSRDPYNVSLPSLDLEAVFGGNKLKSPHSSFSTTKNRPSRTTHAALGSSKTDTLLTEAALAMEGNGSMSSELIETAKRQVTSLAVSNNSTVGTSFYGDVQPRRSVSRRHSTGIFPIQENSGNVVDGSGSVGFEDSHIRPRCLPTMSGLFPPSNSRVPSRRLSSDGSNSTPSRRKSIDGDASTTKNIYSEFQPHKSWDTAAVVEGAFSNSRRF